MDRKQRAEALDKRIQRLASDAAVGYIRLGQALREVRDDELWDELGYKSFDDYCSRAVGIGETGASRRIRIADHFGPLDLSEREYLPVTKMDLLCSVVTNTSNAKAWMKRAKKMSTRELRKAIRDYRKKLVKEGKLTEVRFSERFVMRGWAFTEREERNIQRAINELIERGEARTYGEAIALMAERYLKGLKVLKVV